MYTVKQLSDLAGVTVRTLHHYDKIDLLKPTRIRENGYRAYDDAALYRLQQILFYRELGIELAEIKAILDDPDFDALDALRSHREVLAGQMAKLAGLLTTIDATIADLTGEKPMTDKRKLFRNLTDDEQADFTREARLQYDPDLVNESVQRWNDYSQAQKDAIIAENNQVYRDIADAIDAGIAPDSEEAQALFQRWHAGIRHFYEPTLDVLRGLADLYTNDPRFMANFAEFHAGLADYLKAGIEQYVDDLETAEIERMLAEDDDDAAQQAQRRLSSD